MIEGLPVTAGFMLGLSTGPICVATCLPVVLPFAVGEDSGYSAARRWFFLAKFLAGRLVAYTATGLVAGSVATRLGLFGHRIGIYAWMALSLLLIVYGLGARVGHIGFCRYVTRGVTARAFPYLLGFLTGLSVCPPFLLALSYAMERSVNVMFALVFFVSFFCATSVYVLPLGLLGHIPRQDWLRMAGRFAAVLSGLLFLCQSIFNLMRT